MTPLINNIKAEVAIAELLKNGQDLAHIRIHYLGAFRKKYRNDIETIDTEEDINSTVNIFLNRDSIYDLLPEGLFHQSKGAIAGETLHDKITEHKRYKEEERHARKFFAPMDDIIFRYAVFAELEDSLIRHNLHEGMYNESLFEFWNLNKDLPDIYRRRLGKLMPFQSFIKTDAEATRAGLEYITAHPVEIVTHQCAVSAPITEETKQDAILGFNSGLGYITNERYPQWTFYIKNIHEKDADQFVSEGPLGKTIDRFVAIFIPFYIDVKFEYIFNRKEEVPHHEYIVGYGAVL